MDYQHTDRINAKVTSYSTKKQTNELRSSVDFYQKAACTAAKMLDIRKLEKVTSDCGTEIK